MININEEIKGLLYEKIQEMDSLSRHLNKYSENTILKKNPFHYKVLLPFLFYSNANNMLCNAFEYALQSICGYKLRVKNSIIKLN